MRDVVVAAVLAQVAEKSAAVRRFGQIRFDLRCIVLTYEANGHNHRITSTNLNRRDGVVWCCSVNVQCECLKERTQSPRYSNINHFVYFVPRIVRADLRNSPARFTRTLHRHQRLLGGQQQARRGGQKKCRCFCWGVGGRGVQRENLRIRTEDRY